MRKSWRWLVPVVVLACLLGVPRGAGAQADPFAFRFNSGQTVGPVFEGWSRNPDGSFEMHFGYINRNYVEELYVTVGPNNRLQPGPEDRGQPTFFYPRINNRVFSVTVPSDFGDRELVWTVTVRDEPQQAIAWLDPIWEIHADPRAAYFRGGDGPANQSPTLAIDGPSAVTLPNRLTLNVAVSDDGLPERRRRGAAAVGQESPPTLREDPNAPKAPVNVPAVREYHGPDRTPFDRVNVTWRVWRGPAGVDVELDGEPQDGKAAATLTFSAPGEYLLRVQASDRLASDTTELRITVN